jgi:hypothetical protein
VAGVPFVEATVVDGGPDRVVRAERAGEGATDVDGHTAVDERLTSVYII